MAGTPTRPNARRGARSHTTCGRALSHDVVALLLARPRRRGAASALAHATLRTEGAAAAGEHGRELAAKEDAHADAIKRHNEEQAKALAAANAKAAAALAADRENQQKAHDAMLKAKQEELRLAAEVCNR